MSRATSISLLTLAEPTDRRLALSAASDLRETMMAAAGKRQTTRPIELFRKIRVKIARAASSVDIENKRPQELLRKVSTGS